MKKTHSGQSFKKFHENEMEKLALKKEKQNLITKLANARTTQALAGGHNKAYINGCAVNEHIAQLKKIGVKIPSDDELYKIGIFNDEGSV